MYVANNDLFLVLGVESMFLRTGNVLLCSIAGVSSYFSVRSLFNIVTPPQTPHISRSTSLQIQIFSLYRKSLKKCIFCIGNNKKICW